MTHILFKKTTKKKRFCEKLSVWKIHAVSNKVEPKIDKNKNKRVFLCTIWLDTKLCMKQPNSAPNDTSDPNQPAISDDIGPSVSGLFSDINNGNEVVNHPIFVPTAKFPMLTIQEIWNFYNTGYYSETFIMFLPKNAVSTWYLTVWKFVQTIIYIIYGTSTQYLKVDFLKTLTLMLHEPVEWTEN